MGIYRSTNPAEFDDVDGIIVNESAPAPNIKGVSTGIAILVGQFQRGPTALTEVGSIGELHEIYGKSNFQGNQELKNKKFSRLRIARVVASDAAQASKAFQSSSTDRITFKAKQGKGAYGNNITVKIEAGTNTGKKYTIQDTNTDSVLPVEVYDDIAITAITSDTFANSKLVEVTVNSTAAEPTNAVATALAGGSDGTVADANYQTAIGLCEVENAGNVLFLDVYNSTRRGYLKQHVLNSPDKMVIIAGAENDDKSAVITDVANNRDVEGRIIYAFPWLETVIGGVKVMTSPASWYASIVSNTHPKVDPAFVDNSQFLGGVTGIKYQLTRSDYIQLAAAGVSAFEYDQDIGFKVKSGVVTQIVNSSKVMVFRRRMADYLTQSAAKFLKNYQNNVNSAEKRREAKGGILRFIQAEEQDGNLPKDKEVQSGKAKIVDTESLNTNDSIAAGFFKILWKQRIYSSMRYIVLQAEIGESVVVTEGE